ncbi:TPA: hypothetical protein DDZ86_01320 [Candidatus Dependentiae bacterium]|nr:MAG: hypothetical protein UW09_C0004G0145 [candidate division TM6 bacterium GW2011_GWF2_43_87]HBL98266.1 hypothetical protein [Candidatus Dependentiae bacterium]
MQVLPRGEDGIGYVAPAFLLAGMGIMSILLGVIFYQASFNVKIRDLYAPVQTLTPKKLAYFGGTPSDVTVGMFVRDFPQFDAVRGTFSVDTTVWFLFDPRLVSIERIGDFTFERAEILKRSEPYVRVVGNMVFVRYDMRMRFNMSFDYQDFPFDGHRLNFTMVHYFLSPAEVTFNSSRANLVMSPDINIPGWRNIDRRVATGYSEERLETQDGKQESFYPRAVFSLDFERIGTRNIISIFLPLLLVFFIALFTFSFDPVGKMGVQAVTLSATSITALIAYRFVIENMSPPVGYFMASDYIFLIFLVSCCAIFFINIFGAYVSGISKAIIAVVLESIIVTTFFLLV